GHRSSGANSLRTVNCRAGAAGGGGSHRSARYLQVVRRRTVKEIMLKAEIVAIGSELLTPHRTDTNSLWLTERLNSVGIAVQLKTIVGDDEPRLEEAIRDALSRSDVVILT